MRCPREWNVRTFNVVGQELDAGLSVHREGCGCNATVYNFLEGLLRRHQTLRGLLDFSAVARKQRHSLLYNPA